MNNKRFLETLFRMIRIDSPSLGEKEMSDYLAGYFKEKGLEVITDDSCKSFGSNGQNILVHIPGTMDGEAICFNAHMDTVEPGRGIIPVLEDGIVKSASDTVLGADDKAGIAILMELYDYIKENNIPHREMYYLFTVSEELMKGAKHYNSGGIKAKYFFSLDGGGSPKYLCTACAGKTSLKLEFTGKTAHAGIDIEKGVNAVCMAAEAVSKVRFGRISENTSVNVMSLHGGTEEGSVPAQAEAVIGIKSFVQKEIEDEAASIIRISKEVAEKAGGEVHVIKDQVCLPLSGGAENYFYRRLETEIKNLGYEPILVKTGGSGDINIFAERGFECGGMCIGMYDVHTKKERLVIKEAEEVFKIVLKLMTEC